MTLDNPVFEENYRYYLDEIAKVDVTALKDTLGCRAEVRGLVVPFFGRDHRVSRDGITDAASFHHPHCASRHHRPQPEGWRVAGPVEHAPPHVGVHGEPSVQHPHLALPGLRHLHGDGLEVLGLWHRPGASE